MPDTSFLKLDQVQGESQDNRHRNELELLSWSWSELENTDQPGARKVEIGAVEVVKYVDRASPKLLLACARGDNLGSGVLTVVRSGANYEPRFRVLLADARVVGYSLSAAGDNDAPPREVVRLRFSKIELEYKQMAPDGRSAGVVRAGWDLKGNRPA